MKLQFTLIILAILFIGSLAQGQTNPSTWETYTDQTNGFTIKYPSNWKSEGHKAAFFCGKESGFINAEWMVLFSDVNNKERIDMLFNDEEFYKDRQIIKKNITINGTAAVHYIITTKILPDEYIETVVIKTKSIWYSITNNGIKNNNFHLFYESFKLIK